MTDAASLPFARWWLPAGAGAVKAIPAVWTAAAFFFSFACLAVAHWRATGEAALLNFCFKQVGGPLLVLLALLELAGALLVWRRFPRGEPLRLAWAVLSAAALLHAAGTAIRHVFSQDIALNPLGSLGLDAAVLAQLQEYGRLLGGVLFPLALAVGLALVLRRLRQLGLRPRFHAADWLAGAAVTAYLVFQAGRMAYWLGPGGARVTASWLIGWATDPLFAGLFFTALLLRRANAALRGGFIARCWSAYALAVLLTTAGDFGLAAQAAGWLHPAAVWPIWLIWHPAAAAFALAPLYQLDTMDRAAALRP